MPEAILFLCGLSGDLEEAILGDLVNYYRRGTQIFGVFADKNQVVSLVEAIDTVLEERGLERDGINLVPFLEKQEVVMEETHFFLFHGSFHLWALPCPVEAKIISYEEITSVLPILEKYQSTFDVSQFCAIFDAQEHNILVEGVGGTGKTSVFLARFLFLWKTSDLTHDAFLSLVKIVLFHPKQIKLSLKLLQKELHSSFLLTGNEKYGRMLSAVHKIKFFTAFDFVMESLDGLEVVYEFDLLKKIISQTTQMFIVENQEKLNLMQTLNLTFSQIEEHIFTLVVKLYQENLNLRTMNSTSFGTVNKNDPYGGMKLFYHESAFRVACLWKEALVSQGKIHHEQVISHFLESNLSGGREKYLFIDDLHMANNGEIEAIFSYVKNTETLLFVCQNRAETTFAQQRNSFFQCFFAGNHLNLWHFFTLRHQYRMEKGLFEIYRRMFLGVNQITCLEEYNGYLAEYPEKYFHYAKVYKKEDRIIGIYDEIMRLIRRFDYEREHGVDKKGQMKSVGIIAENSEEVSEIVEKFREYQIYIQSSKRISAVLSDLKKLLRGILFFDDVGALYGLLASNFFGITVPLSNLYTCRYDLTSKEENNHLLPYLHTLLRERFAEMTDEKYGWDEMQEKIFFNLDYLKIFYELTAPWKRVKSEAEQENYCENLNNLWKKIKKEGFLNISELYDFIQQEKFQIKTEELPKFHELKLVCLTKEEMLGEEFGHILLLCGEEREETTFLLQYSPPVLAYSFPLELDKNRLTSEFFEQFDEFYKVNVENSLYYLMSKCQFSFSWLSIEKESKTKEEKFLDKGLG